MMWTAEVKEAAEAEQMASLGFFSECSGGMPPA